MKRTNISCSTCCYWKPWEDGPNAFNVGECSPTGTSDEGLQNVLFWPAMAIARGQEEAVLQTHKQFSCIKWEAKEA